MITKKFESIPSYNFKIKLNIANTPFVFGEQIPVIGTMKEKTHICIWNMITFITLFGILFFVGIILLLIKDIKHRKNIQIKIIEKKTPTQAKIVTKKAPVKKVVTKKTPAKKKTPVKKAATKKPIKK